MLLRLKISNWEPGTKDNDKVNIVECDKYGNSVFLLDVPLHRAKLIVKVFNLCSEVYDNLKSIQ